jgi:proline iminopeptidase
MVLQVSDYNSLCRFTWIFWPQFKNCGFFERDGVLLEKGSIDKIRHIPTFIVQGRWDLVCPIQTAYDLSAVFPEAELLVIENAGHSAFEPGIASRLIEIMNNLRE